ncbi:MAG TPA: general secretion pathway protein GspB [Dokdonella sp.]|uniref:general secretion pathway protein GspB n=1 Tax=Dokdonella sp. TaxID=2291710 RepID=UPI002D7F2A86|nr:general secretion pathway protein GspB [Dokdonella sp.]HET9032691.1 general secretion pathway protein GspB [Dokdonella sp.]
MSLILEALKKSERQRRLGESPSIGSPVIAVRRRRSLLPILIVLIAIGLIALWWFRRDGADPAPATQVTSAPATTATTPAPARVADATTFNDTPPPAKLGQPNPETTRAGNAQAGTANAERRRKLRDGELVATNPAAGPAATIKESEPVSAADPAALASAMADAGMPAPGTDKPAAPGSQVRRNADKAAKPAAAPVQAQADGLKLMWELPLVTRRELPEIKISMHVFAKDPAQRFVIINGERHVQGDDIDGMMLIEIRSDGVVFEHEGVRFLYPRGGR